MGDVVKVKADPATTAAAIRRGNREQPRARTQRSRRGDQPGAAPGEAIAQGRRPGRRSIRQAGETAQLYGSVSARDVALAVSEAGVTVERRQVLMDRPIKTLGLHRVRVALHPEVVVSVTANVAKSAAEAEAQRRAGGYVGPTEEAAGIDEILARVDARGAVAGAETAAPEPEVGVEARSHKRRGAGHPSAARSRPLRPCTDAGDLLVSAPPPERAGYGNRDQVESQCWHPICCAA
jgi:large subunit ribosomal protein L9